MPSKKELCRNWKVYVITSPGPRPLEWVVEEAIAGGAGVVQFRDKTSRDPEFFQQAEKILAVTRKHRIPLIINDRIQAAKELGADGVHLGQDDASLAEARRILGESAIVGRSTHSPEQALAAQKEGFDYIGVGPVFQTPTKPTYQPVGLDLVRFAAKNIQIPFIAIGGIEEGNVKQVRDAGAKTVAVVRAVMGSADPRQITRKLIG